MLGRCILPAIHKSLHSKSEILLSRRVTFQIAS
jgi:hypothetical protein